MSILPSETTLRITRFLYPIVSTVRAARVVAAVSASIALPAAVRAQSRPSPTADPQATMESGRPLPGPVFESAPFTRAVARGTRTRTGEPGSSNWVQHARYRIDASLDVAASRLTGSESVVYLNRSPDTLRAIAVYLRQNLFAPGSPRRSAVPITGGVTLSNVAVAGRRLAASSDTTHPGYSVDGTVMWIRLPAPVLPGDSARLAFAWSFTPPPTPSDGREGRDGHVFFLGYWYPQVAVYDDVNGWVTDPYLDGAEFYMDPADYDVRLTVPHGWVVGATGVLVDSSMYTARTRTKLGEARRTGRVVRVLTPGADAQEALAAGPARQVWHFTAPNVRDFAWGTSDQYAWDATRALVSTGGGGQDTVAINSFFRLTSRAAAWSLGGARFTRDAIEKMSDWLWPYPWPQMTSMEGVIQGGGMEYPMMTLMQSWADTLSLAGDLMHETGHMWFPMQVGSNETRHPWMDEGLTQFDVAQCMRVLYGEPRQGGRPNDSEPGQRSLYLGALRQGLDMPLMRWGDLASQDLYFITYYDKTAQVLAALRGVMGAEPFQRALREYGRRWTGRHPYPIDFFNTFDTVAGRNLSWFWDTWFYRAWPLDRAIASVTPDGDSIAITIEDKGLAPMPVPLVVTRAGNVTQRIDVPVDVWLHGQRRYVVRVAREPAISRVEIDPHGDFPELDRSRLVWTPGS
ncbi:MAG TPA: M1 family metallopeptidase [Gemmatimonadaceae bacterium]|nr:M1 family metallopeptidase [Gemmatimonadaceae bacterium]